jgi:hypothetical protein
MGVYIYCIDHDYEYQSSITGRVFKNNWFSLDKNGVVTVKGTFYRGYAWDGCSPKLKIGDVYFGTSEGVLNFDTKQSKTYYASLIHDVFYQFSRKTKSFIKRREVDREFYFILERDGFRYAKIYYYAVSLLGWIWWGRSRD